MKHRLRLPFVLAVLLVAAADAHAQPVRPAIDALARSWGRSDAGAIANVASRNGVTIEIERDRHGPLNARQVAAVLRRLFDERETVQTRPGTAKMVNGSADRAFGEVSWTARMRGTTEPQRSTVFFGLVLEDDRWRVSEIRVLR